MGLCFICDAKLCGERTRVCSSITPHSNLPFPEKICELLGDEFVVIVTPLDHMCKKCTSMLTDLDKLQNDFKLIKNAMVSYIQKKYRLLSPGQAVKGVEIVNGHSKTEIKQEQGQKRVPSGLAVKESTITIAPTATPIQTPLKLLKTTQHRQQDLGNKIKMYKCGFCAFQSKELGHVRFHMRAHPQNEPDKPMGNQAAARALAPIPQEKKQLYMCQVCSRSFDSRSNCLDHIHKDHKQSTASTSNGKRESEDFHLIASKIAKLGPSNFQGNNHQEESPMDNNSSVDMDMMLNDNAEGAGATEQVRTENMGEREGAENSQEHKTAEESFTFIKSEPTQEEDEENAAMTEQPIANVEDKEEDLDIESMLAAIHNDIPSTSSGGTPSKS